MATTDQNITELPIKTASEVVDGDYLLGIDLVEGYQVATKDFGSYVVNRATYPLNGSTQSVASAINSIGTTASNAQPKETGKGLSANDFTNVLKTKLDNIESNANVNTIESIKRNGVALTPDANKAVDISVPTKTSDLTNDSNLVEDANYVHTDNNYTSTEKQKLNGIEAGAQVNVNADWSATSGKSEILHKPTSIAGYGITDAYTKSETDTALSALNSAKADKATTLSGYGITDAYTKTETDNKIDSLVASDIAAEGVGEREISGNPIVVTDAMGALAQSLSVELEPIQDLHGYDHPWPAGGGKNLLPMTVDGIKSLNTSGTWSGNVYTRNGVTFTILTDSANNVIGIKANGTASNDAILALALFQMQNVQHYGTGGVDLTYAYIYGGYQENGWHPMNSIGDSQVSFTPDANKDYDVGIWVKSGYNAQNIVFYPMIRLASVSDDTFAPYSNICPITPHIQAEVKRIGKNLLPNEATSKTESGITYTVNNDGTVTVNGTATNDTTLLIYNKDTTSRDIYEAISGKPIILSGCPTGGSIATYRFQIWGATYGSYYDTGDGLSVTLSDSEPDHWNIAIRIASGVTVNNLVFKPMIRLATETDDTFEPYQSSSAVIPFTSDVYGGTVDFDTGKATAKYASVDLGTLDWSYNTSPVNYFAVGVSGKKFGFVNMICTEYPVSDSLSISNQADKTIRGNAQSTGIYVKDSAYTDAATFKAAMSGVQLVYELETPIELQLTPAQLTMLEGTNILTSDGTIDLTYLGTVASNVQDEIDEFENGLNNVIGSIAFMENQTAKTSHAVGDYIIFNGMFCKVIASVSAGETLSFGTNIQATTIAAELASIIAQINA